MVVDFDEFARQFRERTAARLLEFEKTLAQAQAELEETAKNPRPEVPRQRVVMDGSEKPKAPPRGGTSGQVKSVLRRN